MTIQNLRPTDKFFHHHYGMTEIVLIQPGCKLCKSKNCPSFLVGDDYEPEFVNFSLPSHDQVVEFLVNCPIEELNEIKKIVDNYLENSGV